jgi:GntR family transcriptional repressor for pyruvate dehydrogenase complex
MLSARGLLSIAKGKGVFVRAASAETVTDPLHLYLQRAGTKDYVLDVVHARQMIEPPIAAAAASHRTRDDLARLRKDIDDLRAARGEFRELARLDMAFHLDLARASRNAIMPLLLDPIHRLMPEIKSSVYATVADARASAVEWHERVLEKVIKRDAAGARAAMTGHLAIAEKHARRMLRKAAPVS